MQCLILEMVKPQTFNQIVQKLITFRNYMSWALGVHNGVCKSSLTHNPVSLFQVSFKKIHASTEHQVLTLHEFPFFFLRQ